MQIPKLFFNRFLIILISLFINQKVLTQTLPCDSPLDLNGQIDGSNVSLVWSHPSESNWISHSNGYELGSIIGGSYDFWIMGAHRFTPDQLTGFADHSLTGVLFYPAADNTIYQIMVWSAEENGEPSLIDTTERFHSDDLNIGELNFIELDQGIAINDEYELWIGYRVFTEEYSMGTDNGPAYVGYGDKLYFDGEWTNLSEYNIDNNWIIAGLISNDQDSRLITSLPEINLSFENQNYHPKEISTGLQSGLSRDLSDREITTLELTNYIIYRNESPIDTVSKDSTTYIDMNVPCGSYTYTVTGLYEYCESEPIESLNITYFCPPYISQISDTTMEEDSSIEISINATSPNNASIELTVQSDTTDVFVSLQDTILSLNPTQDWNGSAQITITAIDENNLSSELSFNLNVNAVNDSPVINQIDTVNVAEDSSSAVNLSATDVDGDNLTFQATSADTNVAATVSNDTLILTPVADWNGQTNIFVFVTDGSLSDTTSFVLSVTPVNDPPEIVLPDTFEFSEDGLLTGDFTPYFNDIDSDTSLVLTAAGNVYINVAIDTFLVIFTADTNWNGFEDIIFTINDQNLRFTDSDTVRVTVLAVNDAPVITTLNSVTITEDSSSAVNLSATDVDGDNLTFQATSADTNVAATVSNDTLILTPVADWNGQTNIFVFVTDGSLSDTTSFVLTVTPVNDTPALVLADTTINEDQTLDLILSGYDVDGNVLSYDASSDTSAVFVIVIDDTLSISLQENWHGNSLITVFVTDESSASDTADFILNVSPVNDPPEEFSVIYPTVFDTFNTHVNSDTAIGFIWNKSNDVDNDVTYTLTIELEFFGTIYNDIHQDITDTTYSVSSNSLDALLEVLNLDETELYWFVKSTDDEYTVSSDTSQFVLNRSELNSIDVTALPEVFALHQNYPNPFNPTTQIRYDLPEDAMVSITIYDLMGRSIKSLVNSNQSAGYRSIQWNATNNLGEPVSAGMYIYTIQAGEFRQTKKMVLLK